ncbi:unnamed protein product [Rotaria sp. Silwood2]|nr:unnamed protein product [Rotaria sp. Silwood2]CAF4170262.1 unnamed protein product [Rotaria sp. Silwood2]
MLGALFQIEKVNEDKKERIWVAHLSLTGEDDFHLKETFSYVKNTIGDDTDLDSLGKILFEMDEYEQAHKCYRRMLDETQLASGNAALGLGKACLRCIGTDESLEHLEEALHIRQRLLEHDHADVGECYTWIGALHWYVRKDYDQVLSNLKKVVEIQEATLPSASLALASTYHNIAAAYRCMEQYDLGLEYYRKALEIREKVLPSNHSQIVGTYYNLASLYDSKGNYSKALEYLEKSMDIKRKILPPTHEELILNEDSIRRVKNKMKK